MKTAASKVKGLGSLFNKPLPGNLQDEIKAGELMVHELALTKLQPGKFQPRRHFDEEALRELADSIQTNGIIEPIIVRPVQDGQYEIIAGERRWRASQMINKITIPAIIRPVDDNSAAAMALVENLQREDLAPMEEAQGIHNLMMEFKLKQKEVAELVGKKPKDITNLLNLLELPDCLRDLYQKGVESPDTLSELTIAFNNDEEKTRTFLKDRDSVTVKEARELKNRAKEKNSDVGISSSHVSTVMTSSPVKTISVLHQGEEAVLDLHTADADTEFCWVIADGNRHRVKIDELILKAVQ